MMRQCLLVVLLAVGSLCQQSFTAKVRITSKPGVIGILNGAISYNAPLGKMRINYAVGPIEYFDYAAKLRFLTCGTTCDTQTYTAPMPIFYAEASDAVAGTDAAGCTIRNKNGASGVTSISVDGAGNPCSARFADGTVFTFTAPGAGEAATALTPPANCPKPLCTKKIDFELIFDESGSISGPDFQREKTFGESIANSFTWGNDYIQMGLVQFATRARLTKSITNSQSSFVQSMRSATQSKGSTCIGCGINTAWSDVSSSGRPTATKVFIVLTDGEDNEGDLPTALANAKRQGVLFFAIGVGKVSTAQIENIGSDVAGVKTTFYGDTFSDLPNILNGLVQATCVDIPGNPCGVGCQGFCSCGGVCVCPDTCDDGNKCTTDSCRPGANGNGCIYAPITCDDGDACTADSCDPAIGCVHTPITCNDNTVCTIDSCNKATGCSFQSIVCDDKSPCTTDYCDPTGGCKATPIPNCPQVCSDPTKPITCPKIPCKINECDPKKNGDCTATPKPCNDNNLCTNDACNPANDTCYFTPINCDDKNACTIDYCDKLTGRCVNQLFNATAVCNDYNACTDDICEPATGCKNVKKTCSDSNVCTDDLCNSLTGCSNPPTDCWKTDPQLSQHPDLIGCVTARCEAPTKGCILDAINNTKIDQCGVCNGDDSTCDLNINSDTAVALGAGAISGIVIGAVAIAGVAGVLGGKKGYDVWLKHRANMQGANTNPMYTDNGLSGSNPMYNGDA